MFFDRANFLVKIGSHHPATCNLSQIHDFIEIRLSIIRGKNADLKALYEQGFSIPDIANQLGMSTSSTRSHLLKIGVTLRAKGSVSFTQGKGKSFKSSSPPPYGYCYLDGQLHKDPREYPILQIIEKQTQNGRTPSEIARFLNDKKFKTRHGKTWRQSHAFNIVQKIKTSKQRS